MASIPLIIPRGPRIRPWLRIWRQCYRHYSNVFTMLHRSSFRFTASSDLSAPGNTSQSILSGDKSEILMSATILLPVAPFYKDGSLSWETVNTSIPARRMTSMGSQCLWFLSKPVQALRTQPCPRLCRCWNTDTDFSHNLWVYVVFVNFAKDTSYPWIVQSYTSKHCFARGYFESSRLPQTHF